VFELKYLEDIKAVQERVVGIVKVTAIDVDNKREKLVLRNVLKKRN